MFPAMQNQTDSDDDDDYVPPSHEQPSSASDNGSETEKDRVEPPIATSEAIGNRDRTALWANFQATAASSKLTITEAEKQNLVKVVKKYLFAGEYNTEIVEVPEDSPEAKKWPLYIDAENAQLENPSTSTIPPKLTPADSSLPQKPPPKKPGPRRPKTVLAPLTSSSAPKAKKLTTLDKSLLDWKAHTVDSPLQDELDANRKSGGYLEKVEFLQRVEERKEENLESLKSRKRRKL